VLAGLQNCCFGEMVVNVCLTPERSADRRSCPGHGLTERKTNRSRHGHCSARGLCLGTEDSLSMLVVDVFIPSAFAGLCEPMAECGDA
jgi:hypothetical protein